MSVCLSVCPLYHIQQSNPHESMQPHSMQTSRYPAPPHHHPTTINLSFHSAPTHQHCWPTRPCERAHFSWRAWHRGRHLRGVA